MVALGLGGDVYLRARGREVAAGLQRSAPPALTIVDRHGLLLRHEPGRPGGVWHEPLPLREVSPFLVSAILAAEDQNFFEHPGVDALALLRAIWLDLRSASWRFGASTISMQLIRLSAAEARPRTVVRKLGEMLDALALERVLEKESILEHYLNRIEFGRQAKGVQAGAKRFFGQSARALSPSQALTLAVLLRGPSYYDVERHRERVAKRREHIARLMFAQGRIDHEMLGRVIGDEFAAPQRIAATSHAPHAVDYLLTQVASEVIDAGGTIMSTIDLRRNEALQAAVRTHVENLRGRGITHAAAVILDARDNAVVAMVGSADYWGGDGGAMNLATWRRYPGSALKPFVYGLAIERGASPASIVYDVLEAVPLADARPGLREHGPVTLRAALAGSYNLAALHLISELGVGAVHQKLVQAGLKLGSENPDDYGTSLALGSAKVRLLDLAAAYRVFVRGGAFVAPKIWSSHVDRRGHSISLPSSPPVQVLSEESAELVREILADATARRAVFGEENATDLSFPVVVKTGTAHGFSDVVAVFATHEWIVAAWAGRIDGRATQGVLGLEGAGPLARAALLIAQDGKTPPPFRQRADRGQEFRLCGLSGQRARSSCPIAHLGRFVGDAPMPAECTWHGEEGQIVEENLPAPIRSWLRRVGLSALALRGN
jgi:penicillin-binding protein 1C